MSSATVYILAGTSTEVLDPHYKAISCMFEALLMLTEGTGDQWRILADSVGRYRGLAARRSTENMDEATTKWFRLTIAFIPPEDSRARMTEERNTRLASPGDTVLSIQRSINKAGQTVLKAQRDPSAFTPWSVCTHARCSNSHRKPPSSCFWQRDLAVNIVFLFRNGARFTPSQAERVKRPEEHLSNA